MKTKTTAGKIAAEVGAGILAAGAAAATGYYFYGSKEAKKHRKIAAKWATDMKKDILKEAKRLEGASPKAIAAMVDSVAKTYQSAHAVNAADMRRAVSELKANWEMVQREAKKTVRKSVSKAKTTVKKAAAPTKKAVKKMVKKTAKKR